MRPVSIVTVSNGGFFFVRLLVERVRAHIGARPYEILVVDRGGSRAERKWLTAQPDVVLLTARQWGRNHRHGEAAEFAAARAKHDIIVLLDSDAHPVSPDWLEITADKLDDTRLLAGAAFCGRRRANPHGWFIHPHFMVFFKRDLGSLVVLRKVRGHDADTGEEATIRILAAGLGAVRHGIAFCPDFGVGNPRVPTVSGGVFHCWYVTRLLLDPDGVARETGGEITRENYLLPLQARLRAHYHLDY